MRSLVRLPSPAMTVALIALFVALGGTGYAATQRSSRDTAHAARKHKKHKKARRGPRGPQGPQGLRGPQGLQGIQGLQGTNGKDGSAGSPAASLLTGRAGEGPVSGASAFESPSGTTAASSATDGPVSMLSPATPIVARDLSVSSDHDMSGTETITLTVNGADTALSCQMVSTGPCEDTTHAVTIPPGSTIAIHYQLTNFSGGGAGGTLRFGWRATTP